MRTADPQDLQDLIHEISGVFRADLPIKSYPLHREDSNKPVAVGTAVAPATLEVEAERSLGLRISKSEQ
jgi:hypothetical protein